MLAAEVRRLHAELAEPAPEQIPNEHSHLLTPKVMWGMYDTEPAPEPVAWIGPVGQTMPHEIYLPWSAQYPDDARHFKPLYTSPPAPQPLSEEQIDKILAAEHMKWEKSPPTYEFANAFARAIEKAHGIGVRP